jgi:plastocyanin
MSRKKRSKQQQQKQRQGAPAQAGPALSPDEQAARREQQKLEWAARKRAQERAERPGFPIVWAGLGGTAIVGVVVLGLVFFMGGGGDGESTPTPVATRDPRVGNGPIAKTVEIDADDEGQAANPTFSVTTITGNAGDIIEVKMNNIGSVHHNVNFAGLDREYGTPDDWVTNPQSIAPGESGTVLVKFNDPGTYPYHCDFHPDQQKGVLILS